MKAVTGKSLLRPVATRWKSLYDSLRALVDLRELIYDLSVELDIRTILTPSDISYIEEYLTCAKPIADALDILQGVETAFYGVLLPTLHVVKRQLNSLSRTSLQDCRPLVEGYLLSVGNRFAEDFDC
ncbi:uncharacterized protein LOC108863813 [Galendromus occidentalis]|uniref:Uncharacterized protein LOC108863813 n=1 Tax=Galendromus occidentalis TaxID=34638 RepID=A0AAJ7L4M2_9ACAR|nr:uncharacterized protein LOC108863813 [Galendromus occidentalis]